MEKEFWDKLWDENDIGFHMNEVNPALIKFGNKLVGKKPKNAFLPMCGKTLDLIWFSQKVDHVYGVELSEKAIVEFYSENDIEYKESKVGDFKVFTGKNISLYCGDFFKFPIADLEIETVFDRGSLVALPLSMRNDYLAKLKIELSQNAKWLLCVFDYPQDKMEGPPFSVTLEEIKKGLDNSFNINLLDTVPFEDFEVDGLVEKTYLINKSE